MMKLLLLVCLLFGTSSGQTQFCEDGWTKYNDQGEGSLCVLIQRNPLSWTQARQTCASLQATLTFLDRFNEFSSFRNNTFSGITDEIYNNDIVDFWSGMYIDDGRLLWDDIGPRFVRRSRFDFRNLPWNWDQRQPDPTKGKCGKASLKFIEGFPNGDLTIQLDKCDTPLPFVCQKSANNFITNFVDFCPKGFRGNKLLSNCYKLVEQPLSYFEAKANCNENTNGELAGDNTDFDRKLVERVVFESFSNREVFFGGWSVWIRKVESKDNLCTTLTQNPDFPVGTFQEPCNSSFAFVCSVPVIKQESAILKASSRLFNKTELLQSPIFSPYPLNFTLNRRLYSNEILFLQTPVDILNSSLTYFKWYTSFDFINWRIRPISDRGIEIILPNHDSPGRKRRYDNDRIQNNFYETLEERQKRQASPTGVPDVTSFAGFETTPTRFINEMFNPNIDFYNVRLSTGYYEVGLFNTFQPQQITSLKRFVRYSETDLYIYVVYVELLKNAIGFNEEQPRLSYEDMNKYNLLQDGSYLPYLDEMMFPVFSDIPPLLQSQLLYYKGEVETFNLVNNTAKLRYFLTPTLSRQRAQTYESVVLSILTDHLVDVIKNTNWTFDSKTVKVFSTVQCPPFTATINGKVVTFNPVRLGSQGYSWERCYPGRTALATASCVGNYDDGVRWTDIVVDATCGVVPPLNQSSSTDTLKNISETAITDKNYFALLNDTVILTDPNVNLTEADIIYTADIVYNYLQFSPINNKQRVDDIYDIVNNVLYTSTDYLESAQKISNAANRIILSADEITNGLNLLGKDSVKIVKDFLASVVLEQSGVGDVTIGIKFNGTQDIRLNQDDINTVGMPAEVSVTDTDTGIYLTRNIAQGEATRLAFQIYGKTDLFSVISSRFEINSKVVAARMTKRGIPVEDLGDEYVTAVFRIKEYNKNMVCAYWNYSASQDAGGWETKGCMMESKDEGHVICKCDHLTNFAVLIDLEAGSISDTDKLVLGIITKIGLILSIIGLGITILTFLIFKHLRKGRGQQVLVNLSVAMICSAILFLVGIDRTETKVGCIVVAALLHYFILVSFMWMLVEGVLQYLRFVKVLGTYIPNFMKKTMIPAWGLPLIPVIVCLAIDYNMYFGGKGYCWMTWEPFLYAFIIPIAVVILANLIVFTMVLCNLCCRRKHKGMASNQSERKMALLHVQAAISILVILGITWLFGFLTVDTTRIVFHYLFAIFNAFQGIFIFLLFTFREKQIRKAWKKLCCKGAPYKSTSSSDTGVKKNGSTETKSTGYSSSASDNKSGRNGKSNGSSNGSTDKLTFNNPQYDH
ncbi:hypothetical protein ACF0H5_023858 [Mactra antiquata]